MPATVHGAALIGVEALPVTVEVDLLRRLPSITVVGLPSASIREATERVRSAILSSGLEFPRSRVVVSLAPADLRKEGTGFDLPMAVGILAAARAVDAGRAARWLMVGELSLFGQLRPARGALCCACAAKEHGFEGLVVPEECAAEAALAEGVDVRSAGTLAEVVAFLNGAGELPSARARLEAGAPSVPDLAGVQGQPQARRALEIAAAGGHNLLLVGPPGCGKTMLAARLPGILPPLTQEEALECTRIHSVAGLRDVDEGAVRHRPFRAPHHTVSAAGLVGGADLLPGEASLAHNGVLFLDEFAEFKRDVREVLRAPIEDRRIVLARAAGRVVYPARFSLVAASNPCPCGLWGSSRSPCICGPALRATYRARLSGPILDRIDLRIQLGSVAGSGLQRGVAGETSAVVRGRVVRARGRQRARNPGGVTNADLDADLVLDAVDVTSTGLARLERMALLTHTSARVAKRVLRVARTVADLEGSPRVEESHVAEAIELRVDEWREPVP